MSERVIYFDNNATTRALPEVVDAVAEFLGPAFGNASSAHSGGEHARRALCEARVAVAELVGASPEQVIFSSSGTEANNLALLSGVAGNSNGDLVTTEIEHSSVLKTAQFLENRGTRVAYTSPTSAGAVSISEIAEEVVQRKPALVSVQWVNNETGVIQPIEQIADLCQEAGVLFHTDAAQAVGKLAINFSCSGIDYLTLTAHKIHGPPGVGVLLARDPLTVRPMLFGGDQEGGARPGTENLPGIMGLARAARLRSQRLASVNQQLQRLRDEFESRLMAAFPWVSVNGDPARRVSNTTNLQFAGLDGQALVARFDAVGVSCSQSSACTNLRPEPSYVLKAMGLSEEAAYASVRFAFGEDNTLEEVGDALDRMFPIINDLRLLLAS